MPRPNTKVNTEKVNSDMVNSSWKDIWEPEYQALLGDINKIVNLYFNNGDDDEADGINISNIDTKYPDTYHYRKLAIILTHYSILDTGNYSEDIENTNQFLPGTAFPSKKIGFGFNDENKYEHESYYHVCKHIDDIMTELREHSSLPTEDLQKAITGWNSQDDFVILLSILEKYGLIRRVGEQNHSEGTDSVSWGIGMQNSRNAEIQVVSHHYPPPEE